MIGMMGTAGILVLILQGSLFLNGKMNHINYDSRFIIHPFRQKALTVITVGPLLIKALVNGLQK